MLSCPRCGTGNLKEGRSLSMNFTRYCSGPSLLFHAQRGTLAKKHSDELMLSGSCPSTYQQQIRNFNSLMVDVSVPTINTLHGMPSPSHLSSTQSQLGNCNVHYSGFDTDLSTPASVSNKHQWLFSYRPCHWKMLFSEKYHMSTPWYCISSSSDVTNEYTQRVASHWVFLHRNLQMKKS